MNLFFDLMLHLKVRSLQHSLAREYVPYIKNNKRQKRVNSEII